MFNGNIYITRYRWIFWFMRLINAEKIKLFSKEEIGIANKNNELVNYKLVKAKTWQFLLCKYFIILIILSVIYTKNDFLIFKLEKFVEYISGVGIAFVLIALPVRIKAIFSIIIMLLIVFYILFSPTNAFNVAYTFKYTFTFFLLFLFYLDTKKEHFLVYKNKTLMGNLIKDKV